MGLRRPWHMPLLQCCKRRGAAGLWPLYQQYCRAKHPKKVARPRRLLRRALWVVRFSDVSFSTLCLVQCHPNVEIANHSFQEYSCAFQIKATLKYLRAGIWITGHFEPSRKASAQKELRPHKLLGWLHLGCLYKSQTYTIPNLDCNLVIPRVRRPRRRMTCWTLWKR